MLNKDIFTLNPVENILLNNGVVVISAQKNEDTLSVARYELRTFVCEGEYERGLSRILNTYLKHVDTAVQPTVWVSGFFGSGKSHLVKMLAYLWDNFEFADGQTARSLASLPNSVKDALVELDLRSKGAPRLSVVGTLKDFPSADVRYSFLQLLLSELGLPPKFHHFKFLHWLWEEGILESVRAYLKEREKDLQREIGNLFVSPILAQAVLQAKPALASDMSELRKLFAQQFQQIERISRDEFLKAINVWLVQMHFGGQIPHLCVVLDEVQQFIGTDGQKSIDVQNLAEDVSTSFQGRILLVCTGQNALTDTPTLQKLTDRFSVRVPLSDTDVETVTRKTVLRKKVDAIPHVERLLDDHLGEISSLLLGTKHAYTTTDKAYLAADYPVLPPTRRFWMKVLQAIDTAGTAGQLRSQLRIIDESLKKVANAPLGEVVGGDFIFEQRLQLLSQNALLSQDLNSKIQTLLGGTEDQQLDARILSVVFLLDQVKADDPKRIPSTAKMVADLLLTSLTEPSSAFRLRVKERLDDLVRRNELMQVGEEVKLQTREGAEWERQFQIKRRALQENGADKVYQLRRERITAFIEGKMKGLSITQGDSKTRRDVAVWYGDQPPITDLKLHLWVHDGWNKSLPLLLDEIRKEGADTPLAYVYLPNKFSPELEAALITTLASKEVLAEKGVPTGNPEAEQARRAMETRQQQAEQTLDQLLDRIGEEATVYVAGGASRDSGTLRANIESALRDVAGRQFPQYAKADSPHWGMALSDILRGSPQALSRVGFSGEVKDHPAGMEILSFIKPSGTRGSEVRAKFTRSPYGWSQDAVDTLLFMHLKAENVICPEEPQTARAIPQTTFKKQAHTLTAAERMQVRAFLRDVKHVHKPGEELPAVRAFLNTLMEVGKRAGGDAPRPAPVAMLDVQALASLEGNELLLEVLNTKATLLERFADWTARAERIAQRMPAWEVLNDLTKHLEKLTDSAAEAILNARDALYENRLLLQEPDPVQPLVQDICTLLNTHIRERVDAYLAVYEQEMHTLQADADFSALTPEQKNSILHNHKLLDKPTVQTYDAHPLQNVLRREPLDFWPSRMHALPSRFQDAHAHAVKLREPKSISVTLPRRTLKGKPDVEHYLSELRAQLEAALEAHNTVILR